MTWLNGVEDLDLVVHSPDGGGCTVNYDNWECVFEYGGEPESAFVTLEVDAVDFGHFGGETMTFDGDFPPTYIMTVYVENISL